MRKKMIIWTTTGILVILTCAAVWHYIYAWVPIKVLAPLFPTNESPWEHIKIVFFPAVIFYIFQYFYIGKNYRNYIFGHSLSLLIMPVVMLSAFYGYKWIFGTNPSFIYNIFTTIICIAAGSFAAYKITLSEKNRENKAIGGILLALIIFSAEAVFTFIPPKLPLFYDTMNKTYGILEKYDTNHGN